MDIFGLYKYVSKYNDLKVVKIKQLNEQIDTIDKLKTQPCKNTVINFFVEFHRHMASDSILMYNISMSDLVTKSNEHIHQRQLLLDSLDTAIKENNICERLPHITSTLNDKNIKN